MIRSNSCGPPLALLDLIGGARSFLCVSHERPDGDAVGSVIALSLALRKLGKRAVAALPDPVPLRYSGLPHADEVLTSAEGQFDAVLILDCAGADRLGPLQGAVEAAPALAVIDHHQGAATRPVDFIDPSAPAAGLLVLRLMDALGVALDPEIAANLYVALATDTGYFRYANTSAEALEAAARLAEAGADPHLLAQQTEEAPPLPHRKLLGRALDSAQLLSDGATLIAHLAPQDFAASHAGPEHTDGIISVLRDTAGVTTAALLASQSGATWRVSFRSSSVDVAVVARLLGGGGHAAAAGCEVSGSLGQVRQRVLAALAGALSVEASQ